MATSGGEVTSGELSKFKCTPCAKKNKNREAAKYCVECKGYCCRSCVDIHAKFPTLEGHQFLDKSGLKATDITSDLPEIPTVRCQIHKVKVMDMYCGNHDLVGCTNCMALEHRSCRNVQEIPDNVNTIFKKADANETTQQLQDKIKQLEKIINTRLTLLKELMVSKTEAVSAIANFRKEMELLLQNLEKESINEVEEEYRKKESMLVQEKTTAENEMYNMKQADNDMQRQKANKAETFVYMKIAQQKATRADDIINSLKTPSDAKITFLVDADVQLNRLKSLTALKPRESVYSIIETSDMNIKLSNDTQTCHIIGSCLTDTGMLLLADYKNQTLKRTYVSTLSALDQCKFPDNPCFVCATNEQEAAVTFYNNTIQFVSLGYQMTRTRQLAVGHSCFGIAAKEDKLFITDGSYCLYIHDMAGNLLKRVSQDSSGKHPFIDSWNIAFGDSVDRMFVVDCTNRVSVLDLQGKHIHAFIVPDVVRPSDIDTDRRGNIFICGYGSNNIVQIGQNGTKKGAIRTASHGLMNPLSICFEPKQCVLYVTQADKDKVKVFKLS